MAQNFGFLDQGNFKIHDLTALNTEEADNFFFKKKNAVGKLSILEPCNKQANQDGRVVTINFDRVLVESNSRAHYAWYPARWPSFHRLSLSYLEWKRHRWAGIEVSIDTRPISRQDLDQYNEGSAFHPPPPPLWNNKLVVVRSCGRSLTSRECQFVRITNTSRLSF